MIKILINIVINIPQYLLNFSLQPNIPLAKVDYIQNNVSYGLKIHKTFR